LARLEITKNQITNKIQCPIPKSQTKDKSHLIVAVVLFNVICSLSFIWDLFFDIWDFRYSYLGPLRLLALKNGRGILHGLQAPLSDFIIKKMKGKSERGRPPLIF